MDIIDVMLAKKIGGKSYTKSETDALLANKQDTYTADSTAWDTTPTANSTKPVTSGGTKEALDAKQDVISATNMLLSDFIVGTSESLSHNNLFRGANLTSKYTVAQLYTKVHAGDFSDLYLGDYINVSLSTSLYKKFTGTEFAEGTTYYERSGTHPAWTYAATTDTSYDSQKTYYTMSTVTETVAMMIAHFDYYMNVGDSSPITYHHVVLIPRTRLKTTSYMNPTNTTVGAYYGSEMHQTILPCYAAAFSAALEGHVRTYRDILTTAMTAATPSMGGNGMNGAATTRAWQDTNIRLMNEVMVYGCHPWSSSGNDIGCDNRQLGVFRFISPIQYERVYYWLSSVVSSAYFASVIGTGIASCSGASTANSVRPLIVFG